MTKLKKRWFLLIALIAVLLAVPVVLYLLATLPMSQPSTWHQAQAGMTRAQVNQILQPADWQENNDAYLIFHNVGLRTWYIDVTFTSNNVSNIRIYHEDPHTELLNQIKYLRDSF